MINSYLVVLEDSLNKKKAVLDRILNISQSQTSLLKGDGMDAEQYDGYVDEKDACIQELEALDEGFDALYEKVRQELLQNKEQYAGQIRKIQGLISEITEKSVSIQAQESRNRDLLTAYFAQERQALGQMRKSSKVAYGYYQSLNKARREDASVMDLKK